MASPFFQKVYLSVASDAITQHLWSLADRAIGGSRWNAYDTFMNTLCDSRTSRDESGDVKLASPTKHTVWQFSL